MNTRKMILSGIIAVFLAMSLTAVSVFAGEIGVGAGPGNFKPQVYMLKKAFDICDPQIDGPFEPAGGSVPPSGQQYGCVDYFDELRLNEYAFTGERIAELVAVRDLNGAIDILSAYLRVDGVEVVKCNDITDRVHKLLMGEHGSETCESDPEHCWFGHDVSADLKEQPPAKSASTDDGFDYDYDKLYQCVLTVTSGMQGAPSEVDVISTDEAGDSGTSVVQEWFFNPSILVNVFTNDQMPVTFAEPTDAGQTVYSINTLKIENKAEGGVDLVAWIAGSDLESPDVAAKCPESNVLDVEYAIEYRCKIGTIFVNPWTLLPNPNDKLDCTIASCQGALPLTGDDVDSPDPMFSVLLNGHTAECWFRLTYPVPCVGDFTDGTIYIYARAI